MREHGADRMDLLKQYLSEALEQAKGRRVGVFGYGLFGAVAYCALEVLGVDPYCFYDTELRRVNKSFFGKPIKGIWECKRDSVFIVDVFKDPRFMDEYALKNGLVEGEHYSSLHGVFRYEKLEMVDPLLTNNRNDDVPGFTFIGERTAAEGAYTIVTLGGSTSDCNYGSITCWPVLLHDILSERGVNNVVVSGGVLGYTSAQERDKFLRDVIPMKPDLVVSLSGDNDIGWTHCNPERNHYARYLEDQIVEPIYRYCLKGDEKVCYGLNEEMSDAERWYRNHRIIHAVASEFGIAHRCFLQPCIVADAYRMSDFETQWMSKIKEEKIANRLFDNYPGFYLEATKVMNPDEGFVDLTDCFSSCSGVYLDGVHCDERGNRMLAERIADEILQMKDRA